MRGEILTYDDTIGSGLISGDDGVRYTFARSALAQLRPLRPGMRVDFVPVDGTATEIMVVTGGSAAGLSVDGVDRRSWPDARVTTSVRRSTPPVDPNASRAGNLTS